MMRPPAKDSSSVIPAVMRLLSEWGATADYVDVGEGLIDISTIRARHDLYVLASTTATALSLAGAMYAAGARTLNPYPSVAMSHDRIVVTRMLQAAGIPVPQAFFGTGTAALARLGEGGPTVLKPSGSSGGPAFNAMRKTDEAAHNARLGHGPFFAQHYLDDGRALRLSCIGDQIFGVERGWTTRSKGRDMGWRPFPVSAELCTIARLCGQAVGLSLYEVDVVEKGGQPYVVNVSPFPALTEVPDAALRLADYIYAEAQPSIDRHPVLSGGKDQDRVLRS
ncbi:MAG: hypothetical protein ABI595_11415 [Actinomycetota bacterium]